MEWEVKSKECRAMVMMYSPGCQLRLTMAPWATIGHLGTAGKGLDVVGKGE